MSHHLLIYWTIIAISCEDKCKKRNEPSYQSLASSHAWFKTCNQSNFIVPDLSQCHGFVAACLFVSYILYIHCGYHNKDSVKIAQKAFHRLTYKANKRNTLISSICNTWHHMHSSWFHSFVYKRNDEGGRSFLKLKQNNILRLLIGNGTPNFNICMILTLLACTPPSKSLRLLKQRL